MAAKKLIPAQPPVAESNGKRTPISQSEVPYFSIDEALKLSAALRDNFGKAPTTPARLAAAMGVSLTTKSFKMLTGSAVAYGLTTAGYNAKSIALTPLADRILRPKSEGDDLAAKKEAFLKPRVPRDFLKRYDGMALPVERIAQNILEADFGIPEDRSGDVFRLIVQSATSLGMTFPNKAKTYVDLSASNVMTETGSSDDDDDADDDDGDTRIDDADVSDANADDPNDLRAVARAIAAPRETATASPAVAARMKRIFITHGKNRAFIDPIKKMLSYGELEAVVSVENNTTSVPIPGKVMDDMRSCSGAIIHVEADMVLKDSKGDDVAVLNPNVLIEIGAAIALYGRRYILLVKDGVKVPSNLQGLYEVRYQGDILDVHETLKLLESINDLKKQALPS